MNLKQTYASVMLVLPGLLAFFVLCTYCPQVQPARTKQPAVQKSAPAPTTPANVIASRGNQVR